MSTIHNIEARNLFDFSLLNKRLSVIYADLEYEKRGKNLYYYWIDKKSIRGVDVSIEGEFIEIRNTVMSNTDDYMLTNEIIRNIVDITRGQVFDEDGNYVNATCVFSQPLIAKLEEDHCSSLLMFLKEKEHEDVAIFGPKRVVHFGERMYELLYPISGNKRVLVDEMFNIALHVQYHLPAYEDGSLMQIGEGDDKKIIQLITNIESIIISKFDYILLKRKEGDPIIITNKVLNNILPGNWALIDEFTIITSVLDDIEWSKLIEKASKYDQTFILLNQINH